MPSLDKFRRNYGPPAKCTQATKAVIEKYRTRLPKGLIEEWESHGWCSYADSQLWLVNPDAYAEVVSEWLPQWTGKANDPIVFARGALGDLLISHGGSVGHLSVHYGRYVDIGSEVDLFLGYLLDDSYLSSALDGKLAREAVRKVGALDSDEMFTFVPALALGGTAEAKHLKKVKLLPQLSILAQLFGEITRE